MVDILNTLGEWGINTPEETWYPEYLKESFPDKIFFLDKFPLPVKDVDKYDQVDIFYQEVLDGDISQKTFGVYETKYQNTMIKLWMYNNVFVEIYNDSFHEKVEKKVDRRYTEVFNSLKKRFGESNGNIINLREELEVIVQLGVRDITDTAYCFTDYKLIIVPMFSCFMIYFRDLFNFNIVKDIATSEGLFLRPCIDSLKS